MKKIEVTKTITEVVGYEANDGTRFNTAEECKKYEESYANTIKAMLEKFKIADTEETYIFPNGSDYHVEVFKPESLHDIVVLNAYIKQKDSWSSGWDANDNMINEVVFLCWNFDEDCVNYVYTKEQIMRSVERELDNIIEKATKKATKEVD